MALWHRYGWIAYLAVFVGVLGHASAEFFAVLSGIGGPELSGWRFALGGAGAAGAGVGALGGAATGAGVNTGFGAGGGGLRRR